MAFWSKKKLDNRFVNYFNDKKIPFELTDENPVRMKFELVMPLHRMILYPYLTLDEELVSFNINITQGNKNYDLSKINHFNMQSKFFKAYLTEEGLVVLEYRFSIVDNVGEIMDSLIESLFGLGDMIGSL